MSPVPVIHLSEFITNVADLPLLGLADDLRDEWEHKSNWEERNELLDRLFDFSSKTGKMVIFLSGDIHIAAAFRLTRASSPKAQVYQLTSSGITYCKAPGKLLKLAVKRSGEFADKKTSFRRLHIFEENNFGLISVRPSASGGAEVAWDLYGSTGEKGQIVRLEQLKLPRS